MTALNIGTLRCATDRDVPALTRLINDAFRVERFFIDHDRTDEEEVRKHLQTGKFLVLEDDASLVGCAYVEVRGERAYMGMLSVAPSRQHSGLGRAVIQGVESYCRSQGCSVLDIRIVNVRTELLPLYRRLGFHETGTAPFPAEVETQIPCHFLLMSKSLL